MSGHINKRGVGEFTSHVLLAFKNDKGIASMGLLLLVGLLMCVSVSDNSNLSCVSSIVILPREWLKDHEHARLGQSGQTPFPDRVRPPRSSTGQQSKS